MAMLMWILLHEIIDQDTQDNEPQEDECPRRRRPLGRGLEPRPPWCVIDPVHDRCLKTLSEEEIAEKRKAEEEWLASVKRANLVLKVVTWLAATFLVVYVAYVRPLVTPEQQQFWFGFPKLVESNPGSAEATISSTLWFFLDLMIFFFPGFLMLILAMLIFRGWKLDELSKER